MALETANQKRKRGRPANASRNDDEDASSSQQLTLTREGRLGAATANIEESDMAEARPRKRGRPAAKTEASSQQQPEPEPEARPEQSQPTKKKKRGRPSLLQSQPHAVSAEAEPEPEPEPEPAQPKKKGRPPRKGVPKPTEPQETAAEEADDENEGNSSLLRRSGRDSRPAREWYKSPRKSKADPDKMVEDERTGEEPEEASSPSRRRGRGRPTINAEEAAPEAEASGKQVKAGKKKGPRAARNGNPTSEAEQASAPNPLKKKVRRLVPDAQVVSEADADAETEAEPQPRTKKKRGRPSLNPPITTTAQDSTTHPKHRQTRSSLQGSQNADEEGEEEQRDSQSKPRSRGRPPQTKDTAEEAPSQPNHKPRGRRLKEPENPEANEANEDTSRESAAAVDQTTSQAQKRKRPFQQSIQSAQSSPEPELEPEPKPYRELAMHTRRVPLGVIETKWGPLDASSISSVGDLLAGASRPVLLRLGDNPTRRAQAAAALNAVGNRLQSKIARGLPFPPPPPTSTSTSTATKGNNKERGGGGGGSGGSRAEELEYERTVAGIRNLEATLDPLLHGVDLLRRERERAQRELEREYRALNSLGVNARAQARERRGRLSRLHVLVPERRMMVNNSDDDDYDDDDDDGGGGDYERKKKEEGNGSKGGLFVDIQKDDPEIAGLAAQVADHMESMRGNLAQIDGVVPAIARSRALLAETLLPHLGRELFEDVVLG